MLPEEITLRTITQHDDLFIAKIIRDTLAEFGANRPGTVYFDETTDDLFRLFRERGSVYYIAEATDKIVGGGGIYPSPGLPAGMCELVKMYLLPEARGLGLGKRLIQNCLEFAKDEGYTHVYIETMPELKQAHKIYERFGFEYLSAPLGNTGHFGCDRWLLRKI